MDIPEGKKTLREIHELERHLDMRLKEARQKAKGIVEEANAKAEALIEEKEKSLESLRRALTGVLPPQEGGRADDGNHGFLPDGPVTEKMAQTLFARITSS